MYFCEMILLNFHCPLTFLCNSRLWWPPSNAKEVGIVTKEVDTITKLFWAKVYFSKCSYPKCIFAKCTRLACILSFASLFCLRFCQICDRLLLVKAKQGSHHLFEKEAQVGGRRMREAAMITLVKNIIFSLFFLFLQIFAIMLTITLPQDK